MAVDNTMVSGKEGSGVELTTPRSISKDEMDTFLHLLQSHKQKWCSVSIEERIAILQGIVERMGGLAQRWIEASLQAKGLKRGSAGEAEEWMMLSRAVKTARVLIRSLRDIQKYGRPRIPGPLVQTNENRVTARVFPFSWSDRLLYRGITAKVWFPPGLSAEEIRHSQAKSYHFPPQSGAVCLVLGAGNVGDLSLMDPLYKMFVENRAVIYKTNPVNEYLGPILEQIYQELINKNFFQIVYGGVEEGKYLCHHPGVDEIHLTGSSTTYEAIIFGTGEQGAKRKQKRQPILNKPITAELGNITPVIIVPGPWKKKEIRYQAVHLASWFASNAGYNCLSPRVIIQYKNWKLRSAFIEAFSNVLKDLETRKMYYPGAQERYQAFVKANPRVLEYGGEPSDHLPWALIPDVDPDDKENICFKKEAFCSLLAETALEAAGPSEFIEKAVTFANETLWGSLCCAIFIHPESQRDAEISRALERAVRNLRYGAVAVNLRTEFPYFILEAPWGAYPGHDRYDIQSGIGKVNNLLMFDQPEKTVLRGSFKMWPNPFRVTNPHFAAFAKKMAAYEVSPSYWKLPGLIWTAVRDKGLSRSAK